jgi:3-oxoacyl-[acyl-carrier protein] reductase
VVTGASRGIGKEIALQLARRGADVALTSRRQEDVDLAAAEIEALGVRARAYACDVCVREDVGALAAAVVEDLGTPDFLVNNAGIVIDKLLLRMKPEDWDRVISTNLTGVFNTTKAFAPHFLRKRGGRIVNISSVIGITGNAGQASYAASKAGIIGFTKSLAHEFATRGITVNAVAPGYVATVMTDGLDAETKAKLLSMIPMGRFGKVEDVANVVIFLLSNMADYVTGQVINCDGGMVMR